ncbi:aspartate dehydrogenase domain-containing protein isoform X1 [Brienomyrus brachyistius]|uniref:aspartate dehydrogenase domain-containing protein isoform X1 n=1 Tax=Brienomyrus brachyistius TaxID=42636 RepID=UPI0020B1929E|nr:aspartate dehydrogenase domain-containing protein isoform X1 [Brienomyrus brachyistius]
MGESVASIKPSECVNTDHSSARIMTYLDLTAHTLRVMAVGVVGYGHLGQYLVERIQKEGHSLGLRLVFVWNRNPQKLRASVPEELILDQLSHFPEKNADLIVEVCHPQVVKDFGAQFLSHAHFLVGSPSALSDLQLNKQLRQTAQHHGKTLYVPSGALWGSQDIQRLNESGTLTSLFIRMSKHPSCFRLTGGGPKDWTEGEGRRVLFKGSVADLCPLAPNNVNTMAVAAIAADRLGFSGVMGEIVSDTALKEYHIVEVKVTGANGFSVTSVRRNPAQLGAVTGSATYASFWSSLLACKGQRAGVCLC